VGQVQLESTGGIVGLDLSAELPRDMPYTFGVGAELLLLPTEAIDALTTLRANLVITTGQMSRISSATGGAGLLGVTALANGLRFTTRIAGECFERIAPERSYRYQERRHQLSRCSIASPMGRTYNADYTQGRERVAPGRRSLIASKVYKGHPASNLEAFDFFQQLRDKHLAHDENSSSQCPVGAAINGGNKQHKVEGVVPIVHTFGVEGPENYRNLQLLIEVATAWVATEFDKVLDSIKDDLEQAPYGELVSRPVLQVVVPTIEDMGKKRP
jgi:hypothetical protein